VLCARPFGVAAAGACVCALLAGPRPRLRPGDACAVAAVPVAAGGDVGAVVAAWCSGPGAGARSHRAARPGGRGHLDLDGTAEQDRRLMGSGPAAGGLGRHQGSVAALALSAYRAVGGGVPVRAGLGDTSAAGVTLTPVVRGRRAGR